MINRGFEFIWTDQKSIIKHKPSQKAREGNGGGQGINISICEKCGPPPIKWLRSRFTTGLV